MCSVYHMGASAKELMEVFATLRAIDFQPRFNIRPTQAVPTIRQHSDGTREVVLAQWGLIPAWAETRTESSINARSETLAKKPSFREAFKRRRCIIPARGFFEFESTSKHTTQKWHIFRPDNSLLAFAGLWEMWVDEDDNELETCVIITTRANGFMEVFHDRQPVILSPGTFAEWLDPATTNGANLEHLFTPCPDDWLTRNPVANIHKEDSPRCIQPVKQQRGLFD